MRHMEQREAVWQWIRGDRPGGVKHMARLERTYVFLAVPCSMQDLSSQEPNPCPLHWKCGILTTGLPGKS